MFKKFLIGVAVVVVVLLAAASVFVLTFDVNRYRPTLEKTVSSAIGVPVTIGKLSLKLRDGLFFQIEDVQSGESLKIESISVYVRPKPLLEKRVEISSLTVNKPYLEVTRRSQDALYVGGVNVFAENLKTPSPSADSETSSKAAQPVSFLIDSVKILDGKLVYQDYQRRAPVVLDSIFLDADIRPNDLVIRKFGTSLFSGTLDLSGELNAFKTDPHWNVTLAAKDLAIEDLSGNPQQSDKRLTGKLSAAGKVSAKGLDLGTIMSTVSGNLNLELKDGVLVNLNIMREIIQKISAIPGAEQVLQTVYPAQARESFERPHTLLGPLKVSATFENSRVQLAPFVVTSEWIALGGSGTLGFDQSLSMPVSLRIHPSISAALIQTAPLMAGLRNTAGEIEIPGRVQGTFKDPQLVPNKDFIVSKLVSATAQDVLSQFIANPKEGKKALKGLLGKLGGNP